MVLRPGLVKKLKNLRMLIFTVNYVESERRTDIHHIDVDLSFLRFMIR